MTSTRNLPAFATAAISTEYAGRRFVFVAGQALPESILGRFTEGVDYERAPAPPRIPAAGTWEPPTDGPARASLRRAHGSR